MSIARGKDKKNTVSDDSPSISVPQTQPNDADDSINANPLKRPINRVLTVEIQGSLARLAGSDESASWQFEAAAVNKVFAPTDGESAWATPDGTKESADIKNVVLHGVKLLGVQSTFPVTLGVQISGVEGKHYTQNGEQFGHVVLANEKWSGNEYLTKPDENVINSDYLRKYPGMTVDNLRTKNVLPVPDESFIFVGFDHPVVEMLEANADVLQIDIKDAELIDGRWYKVNNDVFEDCARLLDKELLRNLPIIDLEKFRVTASRVDSLAWDSPQQACDNAGKSQSASEMILTRQNTLSIKLGIEYGFM